MQVRYWRDSITLFEHTLAVTKDNYEAHFGIAKPLLEQGRVDESIYHSREAIRIRPDYADAHNLLGLALLKKDKLDDALVHFTEAVRINPNFPEPHYILCVLFNRSNKIDKAVEHGLEAVRINPGNADAHYFLGRALFRNDKFNEAIAHFTEAVRLGPDSASTHYYLAQALVAANRTEEAVVHFRESLRLQKDWIAPMNGLAWLLATDSEPRFRNPAEAVRLAERACEINKYENPLLLDTLAAAYAAVGRFPEAIATAEKALGSVQSPEQKKYAERIRKRLLLYKEGRAYIASLPETSSD